MKKVSLKKAIVASVVSTALCTSMLVGATYAWFTDSATSSGNKIVAGTLDVVLQDKDGNSLEDRNFTWVTADGRGQDEILWEPGCTYQTEDFYIANNGNLNMKFKFAVTGIGGDAKLNEVIDFSAEVTTDLTYVDANGELATAANTTFDILEGAEVTTVGGTAVITEYVLTPGAKIGPISIKGHMDEYAGPEYAGLTIDGISITVVATQAIGESDSFGDKYDEGATYLNKDKDGNWLITNAGDLLYFAQSVNTASTRSAYKGEKVLLTQDIDLGGMAWTPIGCTFNVHEFAGTFDGQNHTISNFKVNSKAGAALFGFVRGGNPSVNNLKVKDVVATGGDYVAGIVGQLYGTMDNCHAENVKATATPFLLANGKYDGGAKAGGVVGWIESGSIYQVSNCTATGVEINAYRDLGSVIGMAHNNNVITNCKAYNSTLGYNYLAEGQVYDGNKVNENIGEVIGRRGSGVVETGTYFENVTILIQSVNELNAAIAAGEKELEVKNATISEPINGLGDNVTANFENCTFTAKMSLGSSTTVNFDECTFTGNNAWGYAKNATYENCTFDAGADNAALHFDGLYGELIIRNCVFKSGKVQIGTRDGASVLFEDCVFAETQTTSIWAEKGMRIYAPAVFTRCEFNNRVVLAGSNGLSLTFNQCTMNGGSPVYYTNNTDGIIRGGNVPNVTLAPNYVASTATAQAALDNAKDGDTIYLVSGVEYGTLYVGRPTKNNDTVMYCETHDYSTTNAEEFKTHLGDGKYHTTPQYTTTLKNVTIIGAEGATVAGVLTTSGHSYGNVYDYVRDVQYDGGSAYYATLKLSNLAFEGVTFTGKVDINTSQADSEYNGVSFTDCTFTGTGTTSDVGAAIRYYNESNNGKVANLTVTNCRFANFYQGVYVQNVNGVKVTGCTFNGLGHNAVAVQSGDKGAVNVKNVVIDDNTFENVADRVIRFGDVAADSNITITNNTVIANCGDEDGEVAKASSVATGAVVTISGNDWKGGVLINL